MSLRTRYSTSIIRTSSSSKISWSASESWPIRWTSCRPSFPASAMWIGGASSPRSRISAMTASPASRWRIRPLRAARRPCWIPCASASAILSSSLSEFNFALRSYAARQIHGALMPPLVKGGGENLKNFRRRDSSAVQTVIRYQAANGCRSHSSNPSPKGTRPQAAVAVIVM